MKEKLMRDILGRMMYLDQADRENLRNVIAIVLNDYEVNAATNELVEWNNDKSYELLGMFLIAKQVEGCSEKTINYYKGMLKGFIDKINIPVLDVETNHIRYYLANREMNDKVSKTTQNNERRVLSSFFAWLMQEEYITKNPILKVKTIKMEKRKKKAFTEVEVEKLRNACMTKREKCIIEVLLSTGCRVGGLVGMQLSNIKGDTVTVFEKGKKERTVYLNAKAKVAIEEYMSERKDNLDYAVISTRGLKPLTESGIELIVKNIGDRAGVTNSHPHRYRRTFATFARRRGMPLEDIQQILGHEKIETTMMYIDDEEGLGLSHKKYVV